MTDKPHPDAEWAVDEHAILLVAAIACNESPPSMEAIITRICRLHEADAVVEALKELLLSGQRMKTHDLAVVDSWVVDDLDAVEAARKALADYERKADEPR